MRKYWLIIKNTWDEYGEYRINFVLWRVRVVIRFLITYFLWSSIYSGNQRFFGYSRSTMLTYVLLVFIISNFVFATRTQDIGAEINDGSLTNLLLRPFSYFKNIAARDIGDKLINFMFTLIEFTVLFFILRPPFSLQISPLIIIVGIVSLFGGIIIYFCMSCLLGFLGFWSTEVWGIRFIFAILLDFLGGNFFPIDIFPPFIAKTMMFTPFPYMYYFPVKIFTGQMNFGEIVTGFSVLSLWIVLLMLLVSLVWKKGLRVYGAEGR